MVNVFALCGQADGGLRIDRKSMLRAAGRASGAAAVKPRFQQGSVDEVCFLGAPTARDQFLSPE